MPHAALYGMPHKQITPPFQREEAQLQGGGSDPKISVTINQRNASQPLQRTHVCIGAYHTPAAHNARCAAFFLPCCNIRDVRIMSRSAYAAACYNGNTTFL